MTITILITLILAACCLAAGWIGCRSRKALLVMDALAAILLFATFVSIASAIARTMLRDTVFMTEIHAVLLNPVFIIGGAYLAIYTPARMAINVLRPSS
ncbi:hypothetical protein [Paenibacillus sp. Leaf72]|uniref:hypothetical protein n=1 Tax=Paenibacillus sp. Leaf72 TaxID=1736234 RepID=UPI0006F92D96|nr:hypothetical protein [Paenibacillus sp. Leaf72]KQO18002.1 hypothetical protein ASF12_04960 [Paenibacillus sp. Leaf72]